MQDVLGIDSVSMVTIWWFNIFGLLVGISSATFLLLRNMLPRTIIRIGFFILLVFHTLMLFLFAQTASEEQYYFPLFVQGVGTGILFVPLITNMGLSVLPNETSLVAFLGIGARYLGFSLAIALINFFQLYGIGVSNETISTKYTVSSELISSTRDELVSDYMGVGYVHDEAEARASADIKRTMSKEASIRAYMNYYSFVILMLLLLQVYFSFESLIRHRDVYGMGYMHRFLRLVKSSV